MSDSAPNLKIYPSGFVGSADVLQSSSPTASGLARSLMSRQVDIARQQHTSSVEIDRLVKDMSDITIRRNSFEFKTRVIRLALDTIFFDDGIDDLIDWAMLQRTYADYSDLHRKWIEETISFVELGIPRSIRNQSWLPIVTAGGQSKSNITLSLGLLDHIRQEYENCQKSAYRRKAILLSKWVNRPGGVFDIVESLYVMYGAR